MVGETRQVQVNTLKSGSYVLLGGAPCVVKDIQTSKPGKHGAAKARIEGMGLIDNQKRIEIHGTQDKINVPIIGKKPAQILSINGDIASVMDVETYEMFELKIPDDLKGRIKEGDQVIYWEILNERVMRQSK
ncbi:MAG TPA: translation initiation factor IF-5A [Candidatus Nanoarchaeia archaeon]|nr:translation initiation factor IF-5A [Candidatus Nanoarchaeia archaeon]